MSLFKVYCIISAALLLAACGGDQPDPETKATDTTASTTIEFSDSLVIELAGVDSITVLDLLLSTHQVDYRTTMSGAFVTAIDSHENGGDYFWIYSVNDTKASVACDAYFTSDGDRVQWHFRKFL